jgi:hypothetical protein
MSSDISSILQDLISKVIRYYKCNICMGAILSGYGATDVLNSR